jgi:polyketide biosynthesis acyl carrier protein
MIPSREAELFAVVRSKVLDVLPDVDPAAVTLESRLADLGANSVDRVEVTLLSAEALGIDIPRAELHGVDNLRGLVEILARHWAGPRA